MINNLTVPSLFLAPIGDGKFEIIDGQQRITTLQDYHSDSFKLVDSDDADYLPDRSAYYAGKSFSELKSSAPSFADAFESFTLSYIILPTGLKDSTRREIFKRINEAGTPLTSQDIRLAYWGDCPTGSFIRLAGIYDDTRQGSKRMIDVSMADYSVDWPWRTLNPAIVSEWKDWWLDRQTALGQTASEMFLWFLIATYRTQIDSLTTNTSHLSSVLNMTFDGRNEVVADIFCAQLKREAASATPKILCSLSELQMGLFPTFTEWWYAIHTQAPNIGVDRNRRIALLAAAFSGMGKKPSALTNSQWILVEQFLRTPREALRTIGIDVPESRGKWSGPRGQREQVKAYLAVAAKILTM